MLKDVERIRKDLDLAIWHSPPPWISCSKAPCPVVAAIDSAVQKNPGRIGADLAKLCDLVVQELKSVFIDSCSSQICSP